MTVRSIILDTTVRLVFDAAIVLSLYFLFAGHNQPGGGFIGGLVAAAAVALRFVAGGVEALRSVVRVPSTTFLAIGLLVASATTLAPLVVGDAALDQRAFAWTWPLFGDVKLTTATIFDAGVYLVVVGLVVMILESLGGDAADAATTERTP